MARSPIAPAPLTGGALPALGSLAIAFASGVWPCTARASAVAPSTAAPTVVARPVSAWAVRADVIVAFAPTQRVERWASALMQSSRDPNALYEHLLALKRAGRLRGDRDNRPHAREPKTADALVTLLVAGAREVPVGCYELSVLYVAAARSIGLEAMGVERLDAVGTGQIGHVMAGVRVDGSLRVFDLQNETTQPGGANEVLDDDVFAAHHFNHLAVSHYLAARMPAALEAIDVALRLAPAQASFLNNRATILIELGELDAARAEVTYAANLAPSVPLYRYQLGRVAMLQGDLALAESALRQALALRPRYGLARRDLGWALLLLGRSAEAERELQRAAQDPETPQAALYLGLYWLSRGQPEQALSALGDPGEDRQSRALQILARGSAPGRWAAEVAALEAVLARVPRAPAPRREASDPLPGAPRLR